MDDVTIIRPSARYVLFRILFTLFAVETCYALIFAVYFLVRPDQVFDRAFLVSLWFVHTLKFILLAMFIADIIIRYLSTQYFITKHHLIVSRGIVTDDEKLYELKQVRKISVFQDGMGKRMGYGSVKMLLGARGFEERILLLNIANPHKIAKEIEKYLGNY